MDSGEACLERLSRQPYDAVVLDVWLPGMDGLATLSRMRERDIDAEVVIISGHGSVEAAVRAIKMGAFDFVEKPLSLDKTRAGRAQRPAPAAAAGREPGAARQGGCAPDDGGREPRDGAAARPDGAGGADRTAAC